MKILLPITHSANNKARALYHAGIALQDLCVVKAQ